MTEVAEAVEAARIDFHTEIEIIGRKPSDHTPNFSLLEEELADVIIRVLDLAAVESLAVLKAVVAKMEYNRYRPSKHGKKL